ncbi:MAG: hypothetical protein N3A58_03740 [Spirochaetes bacterium]|nr:hypothetical protein [Spirochaetota bacterium]
MGKIYELGKRLNENTVKNEIHLFCNECGYKWIIYKDLDDYDFEEFEGENFIIHCPICGTQNIDETF